MNKIHLFIFLFTFISCNHENLENETSSTKKTLNVKDFEYLGEAHNAFLTNAYFNIEVDQTIEKLHSKIIYINQFNIDYIEETKLSFEEKKELKAGLIKNKLLIGERYLVEKIKKQDVYDEELTISETIDFLTSKNLISNEAHNILSKFSTHLTDNYNGKLSNEDLKLNVKALINDFNSSNFSHESDGQLVGSILAISLSSISWWEGNLYALDGLSARGEKSPKLTSIAPWLAADLVGALWGGATGAIASYTGTGEVNWTATGIGALSGAVSGSTGAIGKIAKWLF